VGIRWSLDFIETKVAKREEYEVIKGIKVYDPDVIDLQFLKEI